MTKTLRTLLTGIALPVAVNLAYGQTDADIAKAKTEVAKSRKALNLTDDQAAKFQQIDLDSRTKLAEAKKIDDPAKRKTAVRDIVADREKSIKELLTPEQWEKRQASMKHRAEATAAK